MTRLKLVSITVAIATAACGPEAGGQSGTDVLYGCWPVSVEVPFDAPGPNGLRAVDFTDPFERSIDRVMQLTWRARDGQPARSTLARMSVVRYGSTVLHDTNTVCASFRIPLELSLTSNDGVLNDVFAGTLSRQAPARTELELAAARNGLFDAGLQHDLRNESLRLRFVAPHPPWASDAPLRPNTDFAELLDGEQSIAVLETGSLIGGLPSSTLSRTVTPYVRPAFLDEPCSRAAPTTAVKFTTQQQAVDAIARRWVACEGQSNLPPGFAGFDSGPDLHWNILIAQNDRLVPLLGFEYEAEIERPMHGPPADASVADTSMADTSVADASVAHPSETRPIIWGWRAYDAMLPALEFSGSGTTMRFSAVTTWTTAIDMTFVAIDMPITQPAIDGDGARLGLDACERRETHLERRFTSEAEVRQLLVGRWAYCNKSLRTNAKQLLFESNGTYRVLKTNGQFASALEWSIQDNGFVPGQFMLQAERFGEVVFSTAPMKLMWGTEILTALPN